MRARIDEDLLKKWDHEDRRPPAGQVLLWDTLLRGFGARVTPKRAIAFVIQYRAPGTGAGGKKVRKTFRYWPECKVAEARRLARKELGLVAERDVEGSAMPLREAARIWFERVSNDRQWRPRYRKKVDRMLAMYLEGTGSDRVTLSPTAAAAVAELGSRPIGVVRRSDVTRVVRSIPRGAAEQFMAVLSSCFNWCSELEWIEERNPARHRLRVTGGRRERNRSLTDAELVRVWRTFEAEGDPHFGALQLLILTGARRREVTGMEWIELDLEAGTWTLPAERRKTGRSDSEPFVVALAPLAIAVIQRQPRLEGSPHVFWGRRDRKPFDFQSALLERVHKAAGVANWRLHDIRRTMRSGLGRLGVPQAVAEMALGHLSAKGGLVRVYDAHSYEAEKREAWLKWAAYVDALTRK